MFQRSPTGHPRVSTLQTHGGFMVRLACTVEHEVLQLLTCNCVQQHPHANVLSTPTVHPHVSTLQTLGGFIMRLSCTTWYMEFAVAGLQLHKVTPATRCAVKSNSSPTWHTLRTPGWCDDMSCVPIAEVEVLQLLACIKQLHKATPRCQYPFRFNSSPTCQRNIKPMLVW